MANKIRVFGKAQNRTALGIINAYLVMYPNSTLEDLRKAFPDRLNNWKIKGKDSIMFVSDKEKDKISEKYGDIAVYEENFLSKPEEIMTLKDGTKVSLRGGWSKEDYEALVDWAKQYDIEVAAFTPGRPFDRGGYALEYLNGYVPPIKNGKKCNWWLWLIIAVLAVGIVCYFVCK